MPKSLLNPPTLAKPSGYSNGVLVDGGRLLYLAGQTAMDANGVIVAPGEMVAQFRQALQNIQAVVRDAGAQMTDIVKLTLFVANKQAYHAHLKEVGQVYREFFGKYYPAMTLVEVKSLWDPAALIEIEAIAVIQDSES